jgi:hypothetical protein
MGQSNWLIAKKKKRKKKKKVGGEGEVENWLIFKMWDPHLGTAHYVLDK